MGSLPPTISRGPNAQRGLDTTVLLAFSLGVAQLWLWPRTPEGVMEWLVPVAVVAAVAGVLPRPWRRPLLAGLFGACWAFWVAASGMASRLDPALEGVDLRVEGLVADLPRRDSDAVRFRFCPRQAWRADTGEAVAVSGCWRMAWYARHGFGEVREPVPGAMEELPDMRADQQWRLHVRLRRPRGLSNPGGFDSERKALETGLGAYGYVRTGSPQVRLDDTAGINRLREHIASHVDGIFPAQPRMAALLRGLAVGDRRGFEAADWASLRMTGTTHLFSISGLHVGMVGVFVAMLMAGLAWCFPALLRWAPRRVWALPPAVVAATGYAWLAGFEVPTRRSALMIAVAAMILLARRRGSLWQGWCLAMAAVLLLDPLAVLSIGFWLSFLGVAWLLLAGQGRARQAWWRSATQAQWAVSIGLLPVGIGFFAQASWISPLVNLIAIPWVTLLVVPVLLLGVGLLAVWAPAGHVLIDLAARLLAPLMSALDAVAAWPLAASWLAEPSALGLASATVAAVVVLLPVQRRLRWLAVPLLLPLFLATPLRPSFGQFQLDVLDVGQGTAVLVRTRHHALLFDTGARYPNGYDAGEAVIVPALRALAVGRLDALVVSHADSDHAGGAESVLREVPVLRLLAGERLPQGVQATAPEAESCLAGHRWHWDGVAFELLHPPPRYPARGNEISCVLSVRAANGEAALLTGDAGELAELRMLALHRPALSSRVLVLGHHGSTTSSSTAFLDAVGASLAIASAGYRNRFGHPHIDVLRRLDWRGVEVATTWRTGAVHVHLGGENPTWTASRSRRQLWHEP